VALVTTERVGAAAILTLNRPEARNALSIELCNRIVDALSEIDTDPQARVVIIRGEGKSFCSGADFAAVSGAGAIEFLPIFEGMLEAVTRHRLPTIASIHGAALGGGLQLAMTCDFRIAAEDAQIGIPSSRLGIVVNFENIQRLVLLAGIAVAKEVMLTGRTFSGAEAANVGLANQAVSAAGLYDMTLSLASEIAELSPLSVQGAKRAIQIVVFDEEVAAAYRSEDLVEGIQAMREKRSPRFKGT
jgi:enoyl-CoA hydratase/carnithine racemase